MAQQDIEKLQNTTVSDEIIVRDADGRFKVLRHGILEDWTSGAGRRMPGERMPVRVHANVQMTPPKTPQPVANIVVAVPGNKTIAPRARFYFDVADEEEIERFRDRGGAALRTAVNELAARKAGEIIQSIGIKVDEEVKPRLVRAIVSRLKDVRDLIETKEVLLRAHELGGVNLANADANKVIGLTEEYRAQFEIFLNDLKFEGEHGGQMTEKNLQAEVPSKQASPTIPIPVSGYPSAVEGSKDDATKANAQESSSLSLEVGEPSVRARPFVHPSYGEEVKSQKHTQSEVEGSKVKSAVVSNNVEVSHAPLPVSSVPRAFQSQTSSFQLPASDAKPQMSDVKTSARMMGPIDELRSMNPEEFRRIAPQAVVAAGKIIEKIELLADESLLKRSEGVSAWKSSPLYQLYIKIGKESMERGATISQVIDEMQKKGSVALTNEEFEVIADLNQKLAY